MSLDRNMQDFDCQYDAFCLEDASLMILISVMSITSLLARVLKVNHFKGSKIPKGA